MMATVSERVDIQALADGGADGSDDGPGRHDAWDGLDANDAMRRMLPRHQKEK
jgi:hypothetical protein